MSEARRILEARRNALASLEACTVCGGDLAGEPWQTQLDGSGCVHLRCLPKLRDEPELGPGDVAERGNW